MVNATPQLEGLGETLIPAINRLQDIFSQVNAVRVEYLIHAIAFASV